MKEFIYYLKLVERLTIEGGWTKNDNKIISDHFEHLKSLKLEGKLVLAGRTQVQDADTEGIVIIKSRNEAEAKQIMDNDPAIKNQIMTGVLQPFSVAIKE